jgi:hypothetical protein
VSGLAQILRFHALGSLGLFQQAEQAHGHQPGVVEIITANAMQRSRERIGCTLTLVFHPAPHRFDTVMAHGLDGRFGLAPQVGGVVATGAAEGLKQRFALGLWAVPAAEAVEHLNHPDGEQGIGLETPLVAQQMEFHQQLVHQATVERSDHMWESAMKGAFAVGNSASFAHAGRGSGRASRH